MKTVDATHPPALKQLVLDLDKHVAIDVRGLDVCRGWRPEEPRTRCRRAIVGEGAMNTEVALPESAPVAVESKLTVYNGGVRKGVTTLFLYTFLRLPTPAAVVLRAKIKKIRRGRFGTESIVTVPAIAGGYGSITSFDVRIGRRFRIGKKEASVFTFTCPDGRLLARIESLFSNGSKGSITSVRSCWS